jgi:hypothetical protein
MAKVKLQAGAEFDLLNKAEAHDAMRGALKDWQVEAVRGARSVLFSAAGTITAAGTVTIGGNDSVTGQQGEMGPGPGFVWSVKRIAVRGISATTETLSLFVGTASPFTLVTDGITSSLAGSPRFGSDSLVVVGPQRLLLTGTALTSTGQVTVSGQAFEMPIGMMWKLF